MKGIVLLSGGLDSTLVLLKMLKKGHECVPMFVDYNQWSLEGESIAVSRLIQYLEVEKKYNLLQTVKIQIGLTTFEGRVGSVWGRNIALVGLAAMWAYTNGNDYEFIALGIHKGDVGPDCKPGAFDTYLGDALFQGTKEKLGLMLPIKELTIEDIGKELSKFGRELFELTYNCYWYPPCGYKSTNEEYRCPGCRRKVLAMKAAAKTNSSLQQYFQERLYRLPNYKQRTYQSPKADKVDY